MEHEKRIEEYSKQKDYMDKLRRDKEEQKFQEKQLSR